MSLNRRILDFKKFAKAKNSLENPKKHKINESDENVVFNRTDGIYASLEKMSMQDAEHFVKDFALSYKKQGYYKTLDGRKINPEEVQLDILPAVQLEESEEEYTDHSKWMHDVKHCYDGVDPVLGTDEDGNDVLRMQSGKIIGKWDTKKNVGWLVDPSLLADPEELETLEEISKEAQDFVSKKIAVLKDEGYDNEQAAAIAYSYARKAGYKIPKVNENYHGTPVRIADLKKDKSYTWTGGAELMPIKYIGLTRNNQDIKAGSSIGKGFIFQWENGTYIELGSETIKKDVIETE